MSCFKNRRDSGESEENCEQCVKYQKEIAQLEESLKQALERIEILNWQVSEHKSDNDALIRQNIEIRERSEEITSSMADILETKGDLENVNDEFANAKLAKTFKKIYDNKWTILSEWLEDTKPDLEELERIKSLTELTKSAYEECVCLAERQLRQFLFLDEDDVIPSLEEEPSLYKIRKYIGQQAGTRDAVIKEIIEKVLCKENTDVFITEESADKTKFKLGEFFKELIDCCWLMTISHPKLSLVFDVVGRPYSGTIKERFKQFSTQEAVKDETKEKDSVFEVVWPCVVLKDGSGVYAKGDVITVDIGTDV